MYLPLRDRSAHRAVWDSLRTLLPARFNADSSDLAETVIRRLLRSAPPTMPDGCARPIPKPIHKSDLIRAATGIVAYLYEQRWPSAHPTAAKSRAYTAAMLAFKRLHAAGVVGYRACHPLTIRNP